MLRGNPAIQTANALISQLRAELASRLDTARFCHVMGVEGMAALLAQQWGVSVDRVVIAALLHDYCKGEPKQELLRVMEGARSYPPSEEDKEHPALWHGLAAAEIAASRFGITDRSILEAVAHHTMAHHSLDEVGMVLYVADFIEPGRKYEGSHIARKFAFSGASLREAALETCGRKIASAVESGKRVHSAALEFQRFLGNLTTTQPVAQGGTSSS